MSTTSFRGENGNATDVPVKKNLLFFENLLAARYVFVRRFDTPFRAES